MKFRSVRQRIEDMTFDASKNLEYDEEFANIGKEETDESGNEENSRSS